MTEKKNRVAALLAATLILTLFAPVRAIAEDARRTVSGVLSHILTAQAATTPSPVFSPIGGDWTVLCLARGGYYDVDDPYFRAYYQRIETTVNEIAPTVSLANGALHTAKSTENARLILALSAIGKDPRRVGDWDLIAPYNDFAWIKKQGVNGVIYALLALDCAGYETADATIRRQCLDYLLAAELPGGGWTLLGERADPDITGMALQALAHYREDEAVSQAAARGFACLSDMQGSSGDFEKATAESLAQVVTACAAWGVDPAADARFVKNGRSVLDALMSYYIENASAFCHTPDGEPDEMATDQACYALIAYERMLDGRRFLYDMSDVPAQTDTSAPDAAVSPAPPATTADPQETALSVSTPSDAPAAPDGAAPVFERSTGARDTLAADEPSESASSIPRTGETGGAERLRLTLAGAFAAMLCLACVIAGAGGKERGDA